MSWVDAERRLKVLANADTPEDAAVARENGAEGIGLVRTEHMFFGTGERIRTVRRMIMAGATAERGAALADLLPFQREDFAGIFAAMDGCPVTIRLLDPPLHEFLPDGELDEIVALLAADTGASEDEAVERVEKLAEINPMLGFRGAGWPSRTRRSPACRCAPSSRRRATRRRTASSSHQTSWSRSSAR